MAEGVGGRYSLWSAVGLAIALRAGWQTFADLLDGARSMDTHFRMAPLERNLPVLLGIVSYWNARGLGSSAARSSSPTPMRWRDCPPICSSFSSKATEESVLRDGAPVDGPTEAALWGDVGTDSQHAFFQWLHQGTHEAPVEFIVPVCAQHPLADQQTLLVANALAQAQALLAGRDEASIRAELLPLDLTPTELDAAVNARRCPGNRASTTLAAADDRSANARRAACALRAPHVRRRRALRHQLLRSVGRRARQDARKADRGRAFC